MDECHDLCLCLQVLKDEAAAMEEQAPKLAAKAVELTKQLQKEEEVGCPITLLHAQQYTPNLVSYSKFHPWRSV